MSLHSDSNVEMSCADFEQRFDGYVDGLLEDADCAACERHVAMCRACDREVTRWQQARILLSTAVTDFATAVDLSSLRSDVEAALGLDVADRPSTRRAAAYGRVAAERPAGRQAGRRGDRGREASSSPRRGSFAATLRFVSAAAVSAATAAAAVLLMTPAVRPAATVVASAPAVASSSSPSFPYQPASLRGAGRRAMADVAPAAYTPPPLARPQVSHVDGLEAAPGRQVSTWVQPRTNARVIWVQDRGTGAPVRTAGLDR